MGVQHGGGGGLGQLTERTTVVQNAAAATGNGTALALTPRDFEVTLKIAGAAAVLTLTHEMSFDGGATWLNAFLDDLLSAGGAATRLNTLANPGAAAVHKFVRPPGCTNFRSRVSAYTSGTVTVTAYTNGTG